MLDAKVVATTMRKGRRDDHACRLFHQAGYFACDGRLGPTSGLAKDVFANLFPKGAVESVADNRCFINFEVAGVDDAAFWRINHEARAFRNGMADRHVTHCERATFHDLGPSLDDCDDAIRVAMFGQLAPRDIRCELARVNGRAKLFPHMANGANMVFVRVGDEDTVNHRATLFQPSDVRQDQIDARCAVHIGEGDAQINNDQAFCVFWPVSVDIGVHADLSCAAEGQIDQACFCIAHAFSLLKRWMTIKPCIVRSSSKASNRLSAC